MARAAVAMEVAPHVGAWIENILDFVVWFRVLGRTPWVRGLKQRQEASYYIQRKSHPTGAWIETGGALHVCHTGLVAPHVGAWIETRIYLPLRSMSAVAPVGAWIETFFYNHECLNECRTPRGAWIETETGIEGAVQGAGRTPRGCVD